MLYNMFFFCPQFTSCWKKHLKKTRHRVIEKEGKNKAAQGSTTRKNLSQLEFFCQTLKMPHVFHPLVISTESRGTIIIVRLIQPFLFAKMNSDQFD